jgi:hypothetical protein
LLQQRQAGKFRKQLTEPGCRHGDSRASFFVFAALALVNHLALLIVTIGLNETLQRSTALTRAGDYLSQQGLLTCTGQNLRF